MAKCPKCGAGIETLILVMVVESDVIVKTVKGEVRLLHDNEQRITSHYECPTCNKSIGKTKADAKAVLTTA